MKDKLMLLDYLMQSRVFKFVFEHSPDFVAKHAFFFERAPYTNCGYRDYMKYAHDHLIMCVALSDAAYTMFEDVPGDIIFSPVALDYIMKNKRVMDLVKVGALNYLDVLVMAGRRGDGEDGDPKEGPMKRIERINNTPDVYKG